MAFISKGNASARALLKARILLKADAGAQGESWTESSSSPGAAGCTGPRRAFSASCGKELGQAGKVVGGEGVDELGTRTLKAT